MRAGWVGVAVVGVATAAVVAAGAAVPPPTAVTEPATGEQQPLAGTSLSCPQSSDVPGGRAQVRAASLPIPELVTAPGTPRLGLRPLREGDTPPQPPASTDTRGDTLTVDAADVSVLASATGPLAAGVGAQVTTTAASDRTSGLASVACVEPAREWWFLGGDGGVGRRSTLVLTNVAAGPAVVDVEVWTETGLLAAAGSNDLGVPSRGVRTVSLDALASGADRVAVHVRASVGRVGAGVVVREVDGADPGGLSWVSPSLPPTTLAYVPGVLSTQSRSLRLLNTGEDDAIATVRLLGAQAPFTPLGLEAIDVPAGTVVDVDLGAGAGEPATLEVNATAPVVSAVRTVDEPDEGLPDFALVGAAAPLDGAGAALALGGEEVTTSLVVTALPVQVPPLPTPAPAPTATAVPTTPSPTATGSATAAPTLTADVPEADPVTVQVQVVDLDGVVVAQREAVVVPGTSVTLPVDLPVDLDAAWVVLVPAEPAQVLAALATTSEVRVPDPLDAQTDRAAAWWDVTPLVVARTAVTVPPVLPDVATGLPYGSPSSGPE
jgi:hypothetical protein